MHDHVLELAEEDIEFVEDERARASRGAVAEHYREQARAWVRAMENAKTGVWRTEAALGSPDVAGYRRA